MLYRCQLHEAGMRGVPKTAAGPRSKRSDNGGLHRTALRTTVLQTRERAANASSGPFPFVCSYQGALILTHIDGLPRLSARSAWRSDAGHRKPCAPSQSYGQPESLGKPPFRSGRRTGSGVNSVGASESLDDVPHRQRLPSYPADRLPDLYESLSALLGIRLDHDERSDPRG